MAKGGLTRWFRENWVDLSRPKKGGGFEPCGRPDASEGKYPKCVPASRAAQMSPEAIRSAVARKRRAESTQTREDKKPIMVPTVKKASKSIPADMDLYNRVKSEAKAKFDVYPSAYANGWLVQEYKRRGGKYKTISKHESHDQKTHGNRGHIPTSYIRTTKQVRAELMAEMKAQGIQETHINEVRMSRDIVLTRKDGKITGIAGFDYERPGGVVTLTALFAIDKQGTGVGSALMSEVARIGLEKKQKGIRVHNAVSTALSYYYKLGARPSNDSVQVYQEIGPNMIVRTKDIPESKFLQRSNVEIKWTPFFDKAAMTELASRSS